MEDKKGNENMLEILKEIGLEPVKYKKKRKEIVTVEMTGDCNDADYNITKTEFPLEDEDYVECLIRLVEILKDEKLSKCIYSRGFARGEYDDIDCELSEEELDEFRYEFVELVDIPWDGNELCHTITDIKFYYTDENGNTVKLRIV